MKILLAALLVALTACTTATTLTPLQTAQQNFVVACTTYTTALNAATALNSTRGLTATEQASVTAMVAAAAPCEATAPTTVDNLNWATTQVTAAVSGPVITTLVKESGK
jgi:hypothetical protein